MEQAQVKSQSTVRYQGEYFKWRKFLLLRINSKYYYSGNPFGAQLLT